MRQKLSVFNKKRVGTNFAMLAVAAFALGWAGWLSGASAGSPEASCNKSGVIGEVATKRWRMDSLKRFSSSHRVLASGLDYYQVKINGRSLAHVVLIDSINGSFHVRPAFNESVRTTSDTAKSLGAIVACNGGFFNLSDGESTSYVTIDGKAQCEPKTNKALVSNPKLEQFLPQIFDRVELRILKSGGGKLSAKIALHSSPVPTGFTLIHSLQAGPELLPEFKPERGAFVRKETGGSTIDSIGGSRKAARTAIGIAGDDSLAVVCVEGGKKEEFSKGCTLPELADFLSDIGCSSAINLDGGTSTTLVLGSAEQSAVGETLPPHKLASDPKNNTSYVGYETVTASSPERRVKSVFVVLPKD